MTLKKKQDKEIETLLDETFEKNCNELAEMIAEGMAASQKKSSLESSQAFKEKIKKQVVESLDYFKGRVQRGYIALIDELNRQRKKDPK